MRAAVYRSNNDVRIEDMPVPAIGPSEVLVKVESSGICGSDVMEWYRAAKAPLVLGHEIAGEIAEAGPDADCWKAGERVVVSHHVPCNTCRYCLAGNHTVCHTLRTTNFDPGGFAQYVRVPAINVDRGMLPLPDELTFDEGTFAEPLGCVVRSQRIAGVEPGKSVLVLGSGIGGLLQIRLAAASGASKIFSTDISDYRLEAARRSGADLVMRAGDDVPGRVREANRGFLADVAVVCAGVEEAVYQAYESVDDGGTILLFAPAPPGPGLRLPLQELWRRQVTIASSYAADRQDLAIALELVRSGRVRVSDLITHRLPLDEAQEGFRLVSEASESLKVVLKPFAASASV
ncbi:MAG: alcohol dehydrogenase [Actinobacteria bacterium]|nr:MAG: alcohol dehydrogenase [Actinomycetota bacterium]